MIYSMTAFARDQQAWDGGVMSCEMRSVNHRFLEISILLPEWLRALEMPMRELIRQTIKRGKIDCVIRCQQRDKYSAKQAVLDIQLAKQLCEASQQVSQLLAAVDAAATVSVTDILRFPGVMLLGEEADLTAIQGVLTQLLTKTMQELLAARGREGNELKHLFLQRIRAMQAELTKVRERYPQVMVEQRERLLKRFADAKIELDPARLEQEMVLFAQRLDVAEEMDRLEVHFIEIQRVLDQGGVIGRKLDFLMQELNREANTLSSKSTDSVMTHAAVEMKVLIEQMREQVQNVE